MKKDFLPIGSIVKLKKSREEYMITAVYMTDNETGQSYDYSACVHPFGVVNYNTALLFNADIIDQVIFTGYEDEKSKEYYDDINWEISRKRG